MQEAALWDFFFLLKFLISEFVGLLGFFCISLEFLCYVFLFLCLFFDRRTYFLI